MSGGAQRKVAFGWYCCHWSGIEKEGDKRCKEEDSAFTFFELCLNGKCHSYSTD